MALLRYFFPMYPLGHKVSDISSIGMVRGAAAAAAAAAGLDESFLIIVLATTPRPVTL